MRSPQGRAQLTIKHAAPFCWKDERNGKMSGMRERRAAKCRAHVWLGLADGCRDASRPVHVLSLQLHTPARLRQKLSVDIHERGLSCPCLLLVRLAGSRCADHQHSDVIKTPTMMPGIPRMASRPMQPLVYGSDASEVGSHVAAAPTACNSVCGDTLASPRSTLG